VFYNKCLLRRTYLPLITCDQDRCEWYIHEEACNNCFWVLSEILEEFPHGFSIEEIAKFEGLTEKDVEEVIEEAIKKARLNIGAFLKKL